MFKKIHSALVIGIIFALFSSVMILPDLSAVSFKVEAQNVNDPGVTVAGGIYTAGFSTPAGKITVNLPDDLAAGDTISGTVSANPNGKDEAEKQKNAAELSGYVFDINGQKIPASSKFIKLNLPKKIKDNSLGVTLRDAQGKTVSTLPIPVNPAIPVEIAAEFNVPFMGQTGRPVNISGNFDGDLSNTSCEIGGKAAAPLAESPRKSVFQNPADVTGMTNINLREGTTQITQDFRSVGVNLSSSKLNLLKGETTDLQIKVDGLQGITDEVPLNLNCSGSANMQGGNIQNLQISPDQVQADGSYSQTRNLVGVQTGNFNVNATVLLNPDPKNLTNQIVHVERDPVNIGNETDKVWWLKVKTLSGEVIDIYIKQDFKPNLQFCDWIEITETKKDEINEVVVTNYQKTDDPTKPCTLTGQTVHVEGNPLKMPDGRWQIKVKTQDGKEIYIYVQSPDKPDLKFCNWIKLHNCKKLTGSTFEVEGYDVTEDPNKKPPAAVVKPTPTPTPTPKPPPVASKPDCPEGAIRNKRKETKTFDILDKDSKLALSIETNAGGGGAAAEGMAAWLNGIATIGGELSEHLPEEAVVGNGVAGAVLQYVELGGEIIGALAKSKLRNLNVSKVTAKLEGKATKVTAVCITYEICRNGRWITVKEYSETRETTDINMEVTLEASGSDPIDNNWKNITVTSRPQSFDPDKAEKWFMEYFLGKLKSEEDGYNDFKKNCQ